MKCIYVELIVDTRAYCRLPGDLRKRSAVRTLSSALYHKQNRYPNKAPLGSSSHGVEPLSKVTAREKWLLKGARVRCTPAARRVYCIIQLDLVRAMVCTLCTIDFYPGSIKGEKNKSVFGIGQSKAAL